MNKIIQLGRLTHARSPRESVSQKVIVQQTDSGMAFDNSGNLYVANFGASTIAKFDSSGQGSIFASSGLNGPRGLVFDSSGNLYAANSVTSTIWKFDSSGNASPFASTFLNSPSGMAFDSSGNLYVANSGASTIAKFDSSGQGSIFASSGLNQPWDIAVQIPEPATWSLLALAIGVFLAGQRLRHRTSSP